MIDTINDGTLYSRGPRHTSTCKERVQIGRYAADHGSFSRSLEYCERGPVTTHEIVPPFFKNKSHDTEMVRGTPPTIVANVNYRFQ